METGLPAVTLTQMQDGQELATPEVIAFRLEGDALVAFQFDETVYGADEFTLQRIQDETVAAEAAAVAQQSGAVITTTDYNDDVSHGHPEYLATRRLVWRPG